jgi:endonuclease/exonuclease/phosphatase family metal-dependent hydrolase
VFDTPLGVMQALNVHLMPPVSQREGYLRSYVRRQAIRIREIETYIGTLATDMPSVIAGDFNENQHGGALALLFERGWRSAVPELLGAVPTWRWNTAHGPLAWQLDHVVFDARFEALEARVIDGGPSDHLPVVVTLAVVGSRDAVVGNQDAETNHVP